MSGKTCAAAFALGLLSVTGAATQTFKEPPVTNVFLSSHAGQFRLHEKHKPGDPYDPNRFVDPKGYRAAVERAEQNYLEQLQKERQSPPSQ